MWEICRTKTVFIFWLGANLAGATPGSVLWNDFWLGRPYNIRCQGSDPQLSWANRVQGEMPYQFYLVSVFTFLSIWSSKLFNWIDIKSLSWDICPTKKGVLNSNFYFLIMKTLAIKKKLHWSDINCNIKFQVLIRKLNTLGQSKWSGIK